MACALAAFSHHTASFTSVMHKVVGHTHQDTLFMCGNLQGSQPRPPEHVIHVYILARCKCIPYTWVMSRQALRMG